MSSIDQQFVEFIVKSIVGNPDMVSVSRKIDEKGVLLELTVHPDDLGRVIGKRGTTAQSLRTLLRALGTKNEARYNLKIVDQNRPENESSRGESRNSSESDSFTSNRSDDEPSERESSIVSNTRKELEDLDDLDV